MQRLCRTGDVQPSVNGAAYIGIGIYGACHVDIDFVGIDRLIVYDSLPHIHFKFLGCRIDFDGDVVLTLRICLSGCFQHGRLYFFHQLCNVYVVFTSQQGECVKKLLSIFFVMPPLVKILLLHTAAHRIGLPTAVSPVLPVLPAVW